MGAGGEVMSAEATFTSAGDGVTGAGATFTSATDGFMGAETSFTSADNVPIPNNPPPTRLTNKKLSPCRIIRLGDSCIFIVFYRSSLRRPCLVPFLQVPYPFLVPFLLAPCPYPAPCPGRLVHLPYFELSLCSNV